MSANPIFFPPRAISQTIIEIAHHDFERNLKSYRKFIENSRPLWPKGINIFLSLEKHVAYVAAIFPKGISCANASCPVFLHQAYEAFEWALQSVFNDYCKKILALQQMYPKEVFDDFSKKRYGLTSEQKNEAQEAGCRTKEFHQEVKLKRDGWGFATLA